MPFSSGIAVAVPKFEAINGYVLLAHQLHQWPATEVTLNACLSILHSMDYRLISTGSNSSDLSDIRTAALLPVLALMPNCMHDVVLAHSLVLHIHDLFSKLPSLLKNYKSLGLFEALCKSFRALALSNPGNSDIVGQDSREIIYQDLGAFSSFVAAKLSVAPSQGLQELLQILIFLYDKDRCDVAYYQSVICQILEESLYSLHAILLPNRKVYRRGRDVCSEFPFGSGVSVTSDSDLLSTSSNVMDPEPWKPLNKAKLRARFDELVDFSIDFLMAKKDITAKICIEERNFVLLLLDMLFDEAKDLLYQKQRGDKPQLHLLTSEAQLFCSLQDLLPLYLCHLRFSADAADIVQDIYRIAENSFRELPKLKSSIFGTDDVYTLCQKMETSIRLHNLDALPGLLLKVYKNDCTVNFGKRRVMFFKNAEEWALEFLSHYDSLSKSTKQLATAATKKAMSTQDLAVKDFLHYIRSELTLRVRAAQSWKKYCLTLTHSRAIWHFPDKQAQSWVLADFEGGQRMRIRLVRRWAHIPRKFYMEGDMDKSLEAEKGAPFEFLLRSPTGMSGVIIEQLNSDDHIRMMERASLILPDEEIPGEILVSPSALHFVESCKAGESNNAGIRAFSWPVSAVREIYKRWYNLNDVGVELFFSSGVTSFLAFNDWEQRASFLRALVECQPRLSDVPCPETIMRLWQEGSVTNYDYLMHLNKLAGRTFSDLMQYPVMPFILSDYTQNRLNLNDASIYRNLRKPIAVQNLANESRYIERYTALEDEARSEEGHVEPFHYGSHYSNTGIVLHFLVRLPPFTNMFLRYQDGHFDLPDRSFHSVDNLWKLASNDSTSDVKELTPDLFSLPELFVNTENLDLGTRQCGDRVNDVVLPPWSQGNPRLFVKVHRQALESEFVRRNLCHWIDLVFGYKQKGKDAVNSINVFHPATYYGFDLNTIEDPIQRQARATMIKTYGQTPKMLFSRAHPPSNQMDKATHLARADSLLSVPKVLEHLSGIAWGNYVGSPACPPPHVVVRRLEKEPIRSFVAPANNEVYGLPKRTALVTKYSQRCSITNVSLVGAAVITCDPVDGSMNVVLRKNDQMHTVITNSECADVFASSPGYDKLWLGCPSGRILATTFEFNAKDLSFELMSKAWLFGHRDSVTVIHLCPEFGVALSGSEDGSAILWDLHSHEAIIAFESSKEGWPVSAVEISKTSGDIAIAWTISDGPKVERSSEFALYSINGTLVATKALKRQAISALTWSSRPEGVSVNVVISGHVDGTIRFWSSWDMSFLREINLTKSSPILALAYNDDNSNLFVSNEAKEVMILENTSVLGLKQDPPKYTNLHSMVRL